MSFHPTPTESDITYQLRKSLTDKWSAELPSSAASGGARKSASNISARRNGALSIFKFWVAKMDSKTTGHSWWVDPYDVEFSGKFSEIVRVHDSELRKKWNAYPETEADTIEYFRLHALEHVKMLQTSAKDELGEPTFEVSPIIKSEPCDLEVSVESGSASDDTTGYWNGKEESQNIYLGLSPFWVSPQSIGSFQPEFGEYSPGSTFSNVYGATSMGFPPVPSAESRMCGLRDFSTPDYTFVFPPPQVPPSNNTYYPMPVMRPDLWNVVGAARPQTVSGMASSVLSGRDADDGKLTHEHEAHMTFLGQRVDDASETVADSFRSDNRRSCAGFEYEEGELFMEPYSDEEVAEKIQLPETQQG